jgi:cellulose synthase (UDP-forming)
MLVPGLIGFGAALAILPWLDRNSPIARALVIGAVLILAIRYLVWRIFWTLPPLAFSVDSGLALIFLAIEAGALAGGLLSMVFLARTRDRRAEADAKQGWHESESGVPLVDILICTYNEDPVILERTIVGALAQTYPNLRVWLLDDGRRAEVQALCNALGCGYLTRADNAHAKAGNINAAIQRLNAMERRPDFVAILDADFVPFPQFVVRAMSLHEDAGVGIVQTPQHFVNPDPIQTNLNLASHWPDEQRFFFDVVMPSKDAWGGAFCCGTSSVIRFEPLVRIGGFPTDSVTEDFLLSLRLKEAGYSTVYLNEALSLGLAPEGLREYLTQRGRWCLGFMQIARGRSGPFSRRTNLRLLDRVILVENFLAWSSGYAMRVAGLVAPILFLDFGVRIVAADVGDIVGHFLPFFILHIAAMNWISAGRLMPVLSDVSQLVATPTILKAVFIGLFGRRDQKFAVTAKGGDRSHRFIEWGLFRFNFALLIATTASIAFFFREENSGISVYGGLALVWSWYNALVLAIACFVCIERPRYRASERYKTNEAIRVLADGRREIRQLQDISIGGAFVSGAPPGEVGGHIDVEIGDATIKATIIRAAPKSFAIAFDHNLATRVAMTRHFYASGYYTGFAEAHPIAIGRALLARVFG